MYRVIASQMIVPNVHLLTLAAPAVAREAKPGQFVILRAEEEGERIPLSLSDWDADGGWITVVFLNIGATTDGWLRDRRHQYPHGRGAAG